MEGKPWMVLDFVPMADTRRMKSSNNVLSQESSPPIQTICLTNQDCLILSKSGTLSCRMKNRAVMETGRWQQEHWTWPFGTELQNSQKNRFGNFFLNVSMGDSRTRRCSSIPEEAIITREKKSPDFKKNSKDTSTRDTVILR